MESGLLPTWDRNVQDKPGTFWQTRNQGRRVCQKNLWANLKKLQMAEDGTI